VYTGPSLRNLGLSALIHAAAITALMNASFISTPPEVRVEDVRATELRLNGKLYYVSKIDGSNSAGSKSAAAAKAPGRKGGIAAPRAAAAGKAPAPARPAIEAAAAPAAPAPVPEKIRNVRQEARAFIPPEVKPNPKATQTLIQPLSPPDLAPPPVPLPNFRVITDVSQLKKIPKPFTAPGRRTPPTPAQSPDVIAEPALVLVPQTPAPVGDPLAVLSLNDRPIPFNEKVVVPAGNVAQPPLESTGPAGVSGNTAAASSGNGNARAAGGSAGAGNGNGTANSNGRSSVGSGTGAALVGGSADGSLVAAVGGSGVNGGNGPGGNNGTAASGAGTNGANGAGLGGNGVDGAGAGTGTGAGTGAGSGTGAGAGKTTPGSPTINRPPTGSFDAVVVQSSPVDQYPESRGVLSGRPIYSVYIPMGTARDWTLFFCVPGEKPGSGNGPVVVLAPLGAPVKAPYPTKLVKPMIVLPSYEKYVLVHGMVNKDGHFESLRLVRPVKPETDQALLTALAGWEFRAATRDGVAIAVEFLLSIPAKGL